MINQKQIEKFYSRLIITDGCWGYSGSTTWNGYPRVSVKSKSIRGNRLMWMLTNEKEIPDGMIVRHKCDNPICCNPLHLEIGTAKDNTQDTISRNRNFNQKKTHCHKGHAFEGENFKVTTQGRRWCFPCMREYDNKRYQKNKELRYEE